MAKLVRSGTITGSTIEIPEMPPELVAEFRACVVSQGAKTPDELFDAALELVMHHETHGPWAEQAELFDEDSDEYSDVEDEVLDLGREWAYALVESSGKSSPSSNPDTEMLKRKLMR